METPRTDPQHERYEQGVKAFQAALERLHQKDYSGAQAEFDRIAQEHRDEPSLAERARTYAVVCKRKMAPKQELSADPEARYHQAVVRANAGDTETAIAILRDLIHGNPTAAHYFYARASAYAAQGNAEAAIGDLRQSISLDPSTRFQAVNDPDFEQVREEPAFIDIIEPTPTGA